MDSFSENLQVEDTAEFHAFEESQRLADEEVQTRGRAIIDFLIANMAHALDRELKSDLRQLPSFSLDVDQLLETAKAELMEFISFNSATIRKEFKNHMTDTGCVTDAQGRAYHLTNWR